MKLKRVQFLKKKIRIVTFYLSNNIGALLQAKSLRQVIEEYTNNHNVNFYDYMPRGLIFHEIYKPIKTLNISKLCKNLCKNFKIKKWRDKNFFPKANSKLLESDLYIFGSDEIWNFDNKYFGYDPVYFGNVDSTKPKISYAASIGNAEISGLKSEIFHEIKENFKKFSNISVRDKGTYDFVKQINNSNPQIVLDPTLIIDKEDLKITNKNIVLVYGFNFSNEEIKSIKSFSKKNNLKIVSIGFFNKWSDINKIVIDSDEFINYFQKSKFIFTSMFHGVMISYKYNKNFWYTFSKSRQNKIEYFVDYLELKNRKITEENLKNINVDYKINQNKFLDWKSLSKEYLLTNIKQNI